MYGNRQLRANDLSLFFCVWGRYLPGRDLGKELHAGALNIMTIETLVS